MEILTSTNLTIPEMSDLMRHKSINITFKLYHKANYNTLGKKLDEIYPENIKTFKETSKENAKFHTISPKNKKPKRVIEAGD